MKKLFLISLFAANSHAATNYYLHNWADTNDSIVVTNIVKSLATNVSLQNSAPQTNIAVIGVTNAGTMAYSNAVDFIPSLRTNWAVANITNAGTAAYSNASAFLTPAQVGSAAYSNSIVFQPANVNLTNWSSITTNLVAYLSQLGTAAYSNATAFLQTFAQVNALAQGNILTNGSTNVNFNSTSGSSAALNGTAGQGTTNYGLTLTTGHLRLNGMAGIYSTNTGGGGGASTYIAMFVGNGNNGFELQTGSKDLSITDSAGNALFDFEGSPGLNQSRVNLGVTGTLIASSTITATNGIIIPSGTNKRAGNATLVGGTITVNNTSVATSDLLMLTRKTSGGTIGTAITYTLSASTSFTINSDNILDTSTFSWMLVGNP